MERYFILNVTNYILKNSITPLFNTDICFVTKVACCVYTAPQLSRQLCLTLRDSKGANAAYPPPVM